MPDRHAQNPISIRPPKDDRAWLESYAAQAGRTVHAVIIEAIARERARQEAETMDDLRVIARARALHESADLEAVRSAAGDPGISTYAEAFGVARVGLGDLLAIIDRGDGHG